MRTQESWRNGWLLVLVVATALVLASCGGHDDTDHGSGGNGAEEPTDHEEMGHGSEDHGAEEAAETVEPAGAAVEVELRADPASPAPGEPTELVYGVKDAASGEVVTELPVDHERQMHLIAVSRDLEQFQHIHPQPTGEDFAVTTEFPDDGNYVLFDEFVRDGQKVLDRREIEVGSGGGEASLSPDPEPKTIDGVRISLEAPEEIRAGEEAAFTYTLEENGAPVDDLEPYLGAPAHVAIISEDTQDFAHTHGVADATEGAGSGSGERAHGEGGDHAGHDAGGSFGPEIGFQHIFAESGTYKVWAEFNYRGNVIAVPFVVEVS